jgi:hypothetical protein
VHGSEGIIPQAWRQRQWRRRSGRDVPRRTAQERIRGMLGGDAANKTMVMGVVERKGGRIVARIAPRLTMLLLAAYWPVGYLAVTEIGGAGITGLVRFSIGKIRAEELKLSCIRRLSRVTRRDPSCS